jgi:hypothetical protein
MTKVMIEWTENKSNDWRICTIKEGTQTITDVSVNRVNKKGETFPNFDGIIPGAEIECEIWKSPTGKTYMFAPRPQSAPRGGGAGIKVAMAEKAKAIEHSQDRKDNSIQLSSTFRDATILTAAQMKGSENWSNEEVQEKWKMWRTWLMEQFGDAGDITETKKPF